MKIFVSVGTQLPFERLLSMVERVVNSSKYDVVYQISESHFSSEYGKVYKYLEPEEYNYYFDWCDLFISHAGMGSIITAFDKGKNIIICPRRFDLGEHRNDHQLATVDRFKSYSLVRVANEISEMESAIASLSQEKNKVVKLEVEQELIKFLEKVML